MRFNQTWVSTATVQRKKEILILATLLATAGLTFLAVVAPQRNSRTRTSRSSPGSPPSQDLRSGQESASRRFYPRRLQRSCDRRCL